jgi:hypothetical protein
MKKQIRSQLKDYIWDQVEDQFIYQTQWNLRYLIIDHVRKKSYERISIQIEESMKGRNI